MSWSPERLRLPRVPQAVRVHERPADEAIEALFEARAAAREQAAAAATREALVAQVEQVQAAFEAEQASIREALGRAAATLGVEVARAILRTELSDERYQLEDVVRESLSLGTEGRGQARVHVSPKDAERLAEMRLRAGTELVPDNAVAEGEVRVETELGLVVRDPDECLDRVREALLEELSR